MQLRLKNKGTIPHGGGFRYKDPHSGQDFFHYQWEGLLDKIRAHRQANNFPIGLEFEQEVENQVCVNLPNECEDFNPKIPRKKSLTLSDVIRGSQVMMAFYAAGKPLVSREEAEKRARTCLGCVYNDDFSKPCSMGICKELRDVVSSIIGQVGTQYDVNLKACHVCSCLNSAQIWLPLEILDKGLTPEMREQFNSIEHCWKKT